MTIVDQPSLQGDATSGVIGALHAFIDEAAAAAPAAARLWEQVRRASTGGKLVRPRLLMQTYDALGGRDERAAARAGAAFELLHTAFLIHDDVIDRDWVRRGEPNVAGAFRAAALAGGRRPEVAAHLGTSAAIIAGDLAIAGAIELAGSACADPEVRLRVTRIVADAVSATAAGELMDVELASADEPDLASVLAMYEAKTSVYSFCAPLQAAAVLAGAGTDVVEALGRAGLAIGVAYQITDDLLGTFGDPAVTGKSVVSDAREGKRTVLSTLMGSTGFEEVVESSRRTGRSIDEVATLLREAIEASGARAAATDLARRTTQEARSHLAAVPAPLRVRLEALLDDLEGRTA